MGEWEMTVKPHHVSPWGLRFSTPLILAMMTSLLVMGANLNWKPIGPLNSTKHGGDDMSSHWLPNSYKPQKKTRWLWLKAVFCQLSSWVAEWHWNSPPLPQVAPANLRSSAEFTHWLIQLEMHGMTPMFLENEPRYGCFFVSSFEKIRTVLLWELWLKLMPTIHFQPLEH